MDISFLQTKQNTVHPELVEGWMAKPFMLRRACPERTVHPSRASGRTVSRRAQHERLKCRGICLFYYGPLNKIPYHINLLKWMSMNYLCLLTVSILTK